LHSAASGTRSLAPLLQVSHTLAPLLQASRTLPRTARCAAARCTLSRLLPCLFRPVRLTLPNNSLPGPCTLSTRQSSDILCSPQCGACVLQGVFPAVPRGGSLAASFCAGSTMSSSTPSIRVYESQHYSLPHHHRPSHPSAAVAMAIPRAREEAPPPLPPPRHIENLRAGQDPGWQWGNTNSPRDTGFGGNRLATVRPGSSLYGASGSGYPRPREPSTDYVFQDRESSVSRSHDDMSSENSVEHISDDDRSGKSRPSLGNHR
jgi:hypothetical protein